MYVRMPMVQDWDILLSLLGEIRKALALDDAERERAFDRPPTITKEEFEELREYEATMKEERWDELIAKFIDCDSGTFLISSKEWCLSIGPNATFEYDKEKNELCIEWDNNDWTAVHIIPLLQRISLLLPANTPVFYTHLNIHRSLEVRNGVVVEEVTMEDSKVEEVGYLLGFVLQTAMHFYDNGKCDLDIPKTLPDLPQPMQ